MDCALFSQPWSAGGRLALGELDERLDRVHGARTLREPAVASRGLPEPRPRDSLVVDRAPTSRFALGVFRRRGARGVGRPCAPRVVIKGLALFGAVITKPKPAGK
ncbi:hypothetical protein ACWET9_01425 [Streptomyces sp. NPDC004059]